MKESKKVVEFRAFFNNYKIDLEKDLKDFGSAAFTDLDIFHKGYFRISRDIDHYELEVKGALNFLHVMGYISVDKKYDLACEVIDYFSNQKLILNKVEQEQFDSFVRRIGTETAAC